MTGDRTGTNRYEDLLRKLFDAAVAAAQPSKIIGSYLPEKPVGRTIVVGAGKASAAMAVALEKHWFENSRDKTDQHKANNHEPFFDSGLEGLVVVPYGSMLPCQSIKIVEANHPVPDNAGEAASRKILDLVSGLTSDDLVIVLISGGGSALLSCPGGTLSLEDKQAVNQALLASGAGITEMNIVRKHLSGIKGGRLAARAYPAKLVTIAISDVPGDDPSTIASGPTVIDHSTSQDARDIIQRYRIQIPAQVKSFLDSDESATPDSADPRMQNLDTKVICTPQKSIEAAVSLAKSQGFNPLVLGDAIEGEAREVGKVMAGITQQVLKFDQPVRAPAILISGGETTVTLRSKVGRGGRNAEFLLGFSEAIGPNSKVYALACDTDGIDGSEDNAGAIWSPRVAKNAEKCQLKAATYLDTNDAWSYFKEANGLVVTGPTHTNVNDFRAILILKE